MLAGNLDSCGRLDPVATAPGTDVMSMLGHYPHRHNSVVDKLEVE